MEQHLRRCGACRDVCVEHAHRVVTVPFLKAAAESFGVTVADLQRKLGALAAASPGGKARQA
jgi:cytidine deaminase